MDFSELEQWLQQQHRTWQQQLAEGAQLESSADDWQAFVDAMRQHCSDGEGRLRNRLSEAIAEQTRAFCTYGTALVNRLRGTQGPLAISGLVFDFAQHMQSQASEALLRQWQLPASLARLGTALPRGADLPDNPLTLASQLLEQFSQMTGGDRLQGLQRDLSAFQKALCRYQDRLLQLNEQSALTFVQALQARKEQLGLSGLYELWIEGYEGAYKAMLQEADYQVRYAELVNTSLRLTAAARRYWEAEYRQLGLVPERDFDALVREQQQLKRQLRRAQDRDNRATETLARVERELEQEHLEARAARERLATLEKEMEQRLRRLEGKPVTLVHERKA